MCNLLDINPTTYYSYQKRNCLDKPDSEHESMLGWVKKIAQSSQYSYGSPRMRKALNALGYPVGRDKTKTLMKDAHIFVRYRKTYKVTTMSQPKQPIVEQVLNREFKMTSSDRAYVSDITYMWTQEGWLYLAVVLDLFSRTVIGWSMSSRMKASLICDALTMALWQHKPEPGFIVHSDRGVEYASHVYRQLLHQHQCIGSMSRKGNCWDNAVAERFFGRLKQERVQWKYYQTRAEAQQDILNYISIFYNSQRLHSSIEYVSPNAFEMRSMMLKKVA